MSSNLPTRRVTRTRTASSKEIENVNTKPARVSTRTKSAPQISGTALVNGASRVTAGTVASKAKAVSLKELDALAGKRKREVLTEVTAVVTNKKSAPKAKEKEDTKKDKFDAVVLRPKAVATRQPLRTVAATRQTAKSTTDTILGKKPSAEVSAKVKPPGVFYVPDENAMAVDLPQPIPSLTVRKSQISRDALLHPNRQSGMHRRSSGRSQLPIRMRTIEDEDDNRVLKKRRTSSDAPEQDHLAIEDALRRAEDEAAATKLAFEMATYAEEPEAEPEGNDWDDLDAGDADDPLMVSEYVVEIFNYLKHVEVTTMPNPHYMDCQKELAWKMRGILTDWLIQVHVRFRLLPETLFLCVNIIDRFLSARVVSLAKLQLVGITCMFIAAKFEEVVAPSVSHFQMCADSSYTEQEILQAERYILKTLDWNLSYPNPVHFLRRVSKADEYNVKVRTLAKYLLEIQCLEWRLIAITPSLLAAAAIWLARLALGMEKWTPNLAHYSTFPESYLIKTANMMLNYILKPIRHESFHKKYAGKRFYKSSTFMRQWALERWGEGSMVDLWEEMPRIKAEIRVERAEEEIRLENEDSQQFHGVLLREVIEV